VLIRSACLLFGEKLPHNNFAVVKELVSLIHSTGELTSQCHYSCGYAKTRHIRSGRQESPFQPSWSCIIALYASLCTALTVCWSITKRDVGLLKTDALDQWCVRKLLGPPCLEWWCEIDNQATTPQLLCKHSISPCLATLCQCQIRQVPKVCWILTASPVGELEYTTRCLYTICMKTIQQDLKFNNLFLTETTDVAQNHPHS